MTMTIEIPPELEIKVRDIPNLDRRITDFLRHEVRLEEIRRVRHSGRARALAERALAGAEEDKAAGTDEESSFRQLLDLHATITARF